MPPQFLDVAKEMSGAHARAEERKEKQKKMKFVHAPTMAPVDSDDGLAVEPPHTWFTAMIAVRAVLDTETTGGPSCTHDVLPSANDVAFRKSPLPIAQVVRNDKRRTVFCFVFLFAGRRRPRPGGRRLAAALRCNTQRASHAINRYSHSHTQTHTLKRTQDGDDHRKAPPF